MDFLARAPDGSLIEKIPVPAAPTMPCGGADMKTSYFTSLTAHVSAEVDARYPLNGGVFSARVDIPGTPAPLFADA